MYHQAVKNLKQILMEHWSMIHNQPLLKTIFTKPPMSFTKATWALSWMKIKLEQRFSQLLGIFKLWSKQNVGLMRCKRQLISIFYGEIHLLLIILYSELYYREIQNVLWTIMESIEIVPNILKNLSTGCNPIKTSKHIFNFLGHRTWLFTCKWVLANVLLLLVMMTPQNALL